jgi:hypothetical protein
MIQPHGNFATLPYPANWTAPKFQFGMTVQVREQTGQITGLEHYTEEQAEATGCTEGWWYFVLERRTLSSGKVIADVCGYHESVIQAVPSLTVLSYSTAALV